MIAPNKAVELISGAWKTDHTLKLDFPDNWNLTTVGIDNLKALSQDEIVKILNNPIGTKKIREIINNKKSITIAIDDLTRPTPTAEILPILIEELKKGGAKKENIKIIIAGGTHSQMTREEINIKVGWQNDLVEMVETHNPDMDLEYIGVTKKGTPIHVNKQILNSDVVIGVGCIYPHPAAGFSGGSKIIAPGVCGSETTRHIHDYIKGSKRGHYNNTSEIRTEIDDIATRVGLDLVINVVLNQRREISGLFAGDKTLAHREGVRFAKKVYTFNKVSDADIVIIDAYPFDMDFQFAHDRGLWLFNGLGKGISKVIIASCYKGLGGHELYPVNKPLSARITRRIKSMKYKDFRFMINKVSAIKRILFLSKQPFLVFSEHLKEPELKSVFSNAMLFDNWNKLAEKLINRHKQKNPRVAVYKCSPFLLLDE